MKISQLVEFVFLFDIEIYLKKNRIKTFVGRFIKRFSLHKNPVLMSCNPNFVDFLSFFTDCFKVIEW